VVKTGLGGYEIYKPSGGCPAPHVLILITSLVVELHIKLDFRLVLYVGVLDTEYLCWL